MVPLKYLFSSGPSQRITDYYEITNKKKKWFPSILVQMLVHMCVEKLQNYCHLSSLPYYTDMGQI